MHRSTPPALLLLAGTLASSTFFSATPAAGQQKAAVVPAPVQVASASTLKPATPADIAAASSSGWHARQGEYFKRTWGVDIVDVRRVASGEMLAFRYVVLDPEKAKVLNDKRSTAYLLDEKSGKKLQVPQMEKIGALRTTVTAKPGRMYWMIFANTGRTVEVGSKVDVVVGDFIAQGLLVDEK